VPQIITEISLWAHLQKGSQMAEWTNVPVKQLSDTDAERKVKDSIILLSTEPYLLDDPVLASSLKGLAIKLESIKPNTNLE
jgi:hypothetical protein